MDLIEFETRLVYKASSRKARTTHREILSQRKKRRNKNYMDRDEVSRANIPWEVGDRDRSSRSPLAIRCLKPARTT